MLPLSRLTGNQQYLFYDNRKHKPTPTISKHAFILPPCIAQPDPSPAQPHHRHPTYATPACSIHQPHIVLLNIPQLHDDMLHAALPLPLPGLLPLPINQTPLRQHQPLPPSGHLLWLLSLLQGRPNYKLLGHNRNLVKNAVRGVHKPSACIQGGSHPQKWGNRTDRIHDAKRCSS